MNDPQEKKHPQTPHIFPVALIVIIVVVIIIVGIYKRQTVKEAEIKDEIAKEKEEIQEPKLDGKLYLLTKDGRSIYSKGEEIHVMLYGNTSGKEIGGYDSVLVFDNTVIAFESAESLINDFQLFTNVREDSASVTGVSQINAQSTYILDQTPLAELVYTAQGIGSAQISFKFTQGETNDSNLVAPSTDDILGSVKGIEIYVGTQASIPVGNSYAIPSSSITLTVDDISIPEEGCNDCITSALVTVANGEEDTTLTFQTGGFAGTQFEQLSAFGYLFEVNTITPQILIINIARGSL